MKNLIAACLALATIVTCSSCSSTGNLRVLRAKNNDKTLFVGVSPNMEPICYKARGKVIGVEADFARKLAEDLGMELRLVELPFAKLLDALEQGSIDVIMSGMSVTQLRMLRANFTQPYLKVGQLAIIPTDKSTDFRYPQVVLLISGKVGVERGSTGETFARNNCHEATFKEYSSAGGAVEGLLKGKVDLVITDSPVAWQLAARNEGRGMTVLPWPLTEERLAWAVAKGETELLERINAIHVSWAQDGTIAEIVSRWMPYIGSSNEANQPQE